MKTAQSVETRRTKKCAQSVKPAKSSKSVQSVRSTKSVGTSGKSTRSQSMSGRKVVKHRKALLPGWVVITCGVLFVIGSVLLVLAGEALLTSRQVSVGQLQDSLQSKEALHNDFSTQVGLLSQPDRLLSAALSGSSGKLSNPSGPTAPSRSSHSAAGAHGAVRSGGGLLHQPSQKLKSNSGQLLATPSDGHHRFSSKVLAG